MPSNTSALTDDDAKTRRSMEEQLKPQVSGGGKDFLSVRCIFFGCGPIFISRLFRKIFVLACVPTSKTSPEEKAKNVLGASRLHLHSPELRTKSYCPPPMQAAVHLPSFPIPALTSLTTSRRRRKNSHPLRLRAASCASRQRQYAHSLCCCEMVDLLID